LISYLPEPLQALFPQPFRPPPPPTGKPLKLADFDKLHPDKAFNPNPTGTPTPTPKDPDPPPKKDPEPAVKKPAADCYDAPSGKTAFLSVEASVGVRVLIDGKRVCFAATKLPIASGSHKVTIIEPKSKQEYASTTRFEAGKTVKLTPVFQKR
jgi:hypothetical protein